MIPYKTVRRILKDNVNGEVTHESIVFTQYFLECLCIYVARASLIEFDNYNSEREYQGLPKVKRIPSSIYKKILVELLKQIKDGKDGDVGYCQEQTTTLSKQVR